MAFISYALTTEAFLSGRKTVTRRFWKPNHLANWQKWYDEGKRLHDGWDKVPFAGGKKLAPFYLTARPYLERLGDMPETDLIAEGGMVDSVPAFCDFVGRVPDDVPAVVRFRLVLRIVDCPTCDGRWLTTVDRTGLSGPDTYFYYHHINKDGLTFPSPPCADEMDEALAYLAELHPAGV